MVQGRSNKTIAIGFASVCFFNPLSPCHSSTKGFVFPIMTCAGAEHSVHGVRHAMLKALLAPVARLRAGLPLVVDGQELLVRAAFVCFSADLPAISKVDLTQRERKVSDDPLFGPTGVGDGGPSKRLPLPVLPLQNPSGRTRAIPTACLDAQAAGGSVGHAEAPASVP